MARPKFDRKMVLSLDEELYQVLNELGEVSEKPAAAMVREILQAAIPQMRQSIKMLRQLREGLLSEAVETQLRSTSDAQMKLFDEQRKFFEVADKARSKGSPKK